MVPPTTSVSSPSARLSFTGVRSKDWVASLSPSGIVIVKPWTVGKSVPGNAVPPATVTATSVASTRAAPSSVADTVTCCVAASSSTRSGDRPRITFREVSSSSVTDTATTPLTNPV